MNVKTLLEFLKDSDPKAEVVVSRVSEANGFSPLTLATQAFYTQNKMRLWEVEVNNDPFKGSKKCVLLWPSN